MIRSRGVDGNDAEIVISQIVQSIGGGIASTATQVLHTAKFSYWWCSGPFVDVRLRLPLRDPYPIRGSLWPQRSSCCGRKLAELLEMPSVSMVGRFWGGGSFYPRQPAASGGT